MIRAVIVIKDNVVFDATYFDTPEEQEAYFAAECAEYGVEATDADFEDGYIELECGTSICLTTILKDKEH